MVRWREFYFRTYDWTYARLLMSSGQGRERVSSQFHWPAVGWAVAFVNWTGWDDRTRGLKPLAIVFARDAEFVELDLERVAHAHRGEGGGGAEEAMEGRSSGVVWGIRSPSVFGRRHYAVETAFHSLAKIALKNEDFFLYFLLAKWFRAM